MPLSSTSFQEEVNIIEHLEYVNHVNLNIDNVIRRKRVAQALDSTTTLPRGKLGTKNKWFRLPFLGDCSRKLGRILRPFNFKPAYYSLNSLQKIFSRLKDPIPQMEKSGVYELKCDECSAVYIGETGRKLNIRFHEHIDDFKKKRSNKSAFASHLLESGHSVDRVNIRLLHEENLFNRRNTLEAMEICKRKHQLPNNCTLLNGYIPEFRLIERLYS